MFGADCYLVDVVGVDARVEAHVQVVEHLHHLQGGAGSRDGGEAHDVGEEDGHLGRNERGNSLVGATQIWTTHTLDPDVHHNKN